MAGLGDNDAEPRRFQARPKTRTMAETVSSLPSNDQNLIWIDLEMTGLVPERDRIIEIAVVVTDAQLTKRVEGPVFAIHQSDATLDAMDA
jgi:oligoribonuclease